MTNLEKNLHLIPESSLPFLDLRGPFALVLFCFFFFFLCSRVQRFMTSHAQKKKLKKKPLFIFFVQFPFFGHSFLFYGKYRKERGGKRRYGVDRIPHEWSQLCWHQDRAGERDPPGLLPAPLCPDGVQPPGAPAAPSRTAPDSQRPVTHATAH